MVVRTVKINIGLNEEQKEIMLETMKQAQSIYNVFVNYCCDNTTCSYPTLHKTYYQKTVEQFPNFPTGLLQSVAKNACGSVKSFNRNNKGKKWQYAGQKRTLQLPLNVLTFSLRGNLATISSVKKRQRFLIDIPEWFVSKYKIENTNKIQFATLKYFNSQFQLSLVYKVEGGIKKENENIIGIDRGLYNLATLSDGTNYTSSKNHSIKRGYAYNRAVLQSVGTKSAKRKLKKLSGKEKRYMKDVNHCITKELANRADVSTYVLEDLKNIRKTEKKLGKKVRTWISNWSFAEFESQLKYKCEMSGIAVETVDPHYTSQKCNACGTIDKTARTKSRYVCKVCGHTDHADINASKNIRDNYVRSLETKQAEFNQPIVVNFVQPQSYSLVG